MTCDPVTRAIRDEVGRLLGITKYEEEMLAVMAGEAFLRVLAVSALTGMTIQAIDRDMAKGTFPKALSLGRNARVWRLTEIKKWQDDRIAERDAALINIDQLAEEFCRHEVPAKAARPKRSRQREAA